MNLNNRRTRINSFRQTIDLIQIEDSANDGVRLLEDLDRLCNQSGLGETYSFTQRFLDFETYVVF